MSTTTTGDLVDRMYLYYQPFFGSKDEAQRVVSGMLEICASELVAGRSVRLNNLGVLRPYEFKRSVIFGKPNPNADQIYRQVKFREGRPLRRAMNESR